jgi:hypothetical protein
MGKLGNVRPLGQYKPRTPQFRVRREYGKGYVVVDKDGAHVSVVHGARDCAQTVCDNMTAAFMAKAKRKDRPCLSCGTVFRSDGVHNRLCGICRHRSADDMGTYGFGKRSGRAG